MQMLQDECDALETVEGLTVMDSTVVFLLLLLFFFFFKATLALNQLVRNRLAGIS